MSGSKNTELTVKYVCRSLATTSFGLRMIDLVAYSTNPIAEKISASATVDDQAAAGSSRRPPQPAQQPVQQRERDVEEHHLLQRRLEARRVDRLQPVQHDVDREQPLDPDRPAAGAVVTRDRRIALAGGARSAGTIQASAPAATTRYSGTSRFDVVPPAWIGTRNGSASDRQRRQQRPAGGRSRRATAAEHRDRDDRTDDARTAGGGGPRAAAASARCRPAAGPARAPARRASRAPASAARVAAARHAANSATTTTPSSGSGPVTAANSITGVDHPLPSAHVSREARVGAALAAISLSACGTTAKPEAGAAEGCTTVTHGGSTIRARRTCACLRDDHLPVTEFGHTDLQIGRARGPTVHFTPTPGEAQEAQINGQVQSAEVIGSALLYPNQASDTLLQKIEDCLREGSHGVAAAAPGSRRRTHGGVLTSSGPRAEQRRDARGARGRTRRRAPRRHALTRHRWRRCPARPRSCSASGSWSGCPGTVAPSWLLRRGSRPARSAR